MEQVRKTYFDPLATSKGQIRNILQNLDIGSAHPFSPESILLCKTKNGIEDIDISGFEEEYFYNAVDLGEMGETLSKRMDNFKSRLGAFNDFQVSQAPSTTFKIPLHSGKISILVVSLRYPTYYDFCLGDVDGNTSCWCAKETLGGISHSGDCNESNDLLQFAKLDADKLSEEKPICVFISGFNNTQITKFLGTHPALMTLYIIPVPLDKATIGDATICCPLVVKRVGSDLICSILSRAATDRMKTCSGGKMESPIFAEAIRRAEWTIDVPEEVSADVVEPAQESAAVETKIEAVESRSAVITTNADTLPHFVVSDAQVIRFGNRLEFIDEQADKESEKSAVVLPCIFGSQLEGPVLLSTGKTPRNVPFTDSKSLCAYYEGLESVVVVVDERMTDNARNLATSLRMNALFIVQLKADKLETAEKVSEALSAANINAVTALAGPQSLILAQVGADKFYFYRGLADPKVLDTSKLGFGADVTDVIKAADLASILIPKISRLVDLEEDNDVILPYTSQVVKIENLAQLLEKMPLEKIKTHLHDDIIAMVPQLQSLLNQQDLQRLSKTLVDTLSAKVDKIMVPLREEYIAFLTDSFDFDDKEAMLKKNRMLGDLRKTSKETQAALEPVIASLANMMSSQTTSKKTHDMKRLMRKTQIDNNVQATKNMNFNKLAGLLEEHAADMGVMLLNIETDPYEQVLKTLTRDCTINAKPVCSLDDRILYLDGFDAGIIMEQSQGDHNGPLLSQSGPTHPTLSLPYLNKTRGQGSMLAWVCWDEFVNLKSPYTVRWMEKCNESHIAALRIMMRDTLSQAVSGREHNFQAGAPEIGQLMSSLLMAAMAKLAGMRTSSPVVLDTAEDTVTKLMRGLFGNLMTIAGSGVRPLSMVWQLVGVNPSYDIPNTDADWVWYENTVELYPYTGWPLEQFHENLARLLDKIILRVITKNENTADLKKNHVADLATFCKLRNIQLEHCRTVITVFERMLTDSDADVKAIAGRLLQNVPSVLQKQTKGYTRMMQYLEHLHNGGSRKASEDLVYANVYTKRSAAFKDLKTAVSEACEAKDWPTAKANAQAVVDKHAEIASFWQIEIKDLKVQNLHHYHELIHADFSEEADQVTKNNTKKAVQKVLADAEKNRVPWQVGKGVKDVEPLDEAFLQLCLTGTRPEAGTQEAEVSEVVATVNYNGFAQFAGSLQAKFISTMERDLSAEDVCTILKVPVSSMRVFVTALNPDFEWKDLGQRFKMTVLGLLKDRSNRVESRPASKMLRRKV
ncbi:hypothetical protein NW768_007763 [Fusarium equiseti]|uniref:Uncharacterized protein n=1 Tax=Fusarium equiseti TaxID=61235 RepID=A0ABQ8R8S7_FUSEQ|nr:hypothetical protein NW768_007763 [Fusarium equiseti]